MLSRVLDIYTFDTPSQETTCAQNKSDVFLITSSKSAQETDVAMFSLQQAPNLPMNAIV